jgi:hypothetical protein
VENKFGEEQFGFRGNRSATDLIFTVRQILLKRQELSKNTCLAFIDIERAYESINKQEIWKALPMANISKGLIETVKNIYEKY